MKVVFFGTPEYAVPALRAIINSNHEVVAVVSQPDKPKGRSNKLVPTPVKALAMEHGIDVYQPDKIRKDDISQLLSIPADIYVTCAYGQILGEDVLFNTKYGVINLHGSLLPKYRGASPVQSVLINCESVTGVTVLKSGIGLDDGDILHSRELVIDEDDNAISLFDKLSNLSAEVIVDVLDKIERGNITYTPQDNSLATKCSLLSPEMGNIDFNLSAKKIVGLIKGLAMWPNARIIIDDVYFKLYNAKLSSIEEVAGYKPGQVVVADNKRGLHIMCADRAIEITEFLPINSKKMSARSYLNGKQIKIGSYVK
ncbi:MAG: methionyl-tRNA formyltransferase [Clostridiales bacterium]|nr:methionyl-tRNA formyltransferase [Clostridiales bacterium]